MTSGKRVTVRIRGGLGNQLFCYAAARRLALANDAELLLDLVSGFRKRQVRRAPALHRFHIDAPAASARDRLGSGLRLANGWLRLQSRLQPFGRSRYIRERSMAFDERLLQLRIKDCVYLNGLWQSERYFADVADTIREDLRIREPTDRDNQAMAARIRNSEAVALHVRGFRAAPPGSKACLRMIRYYRRAIEQVMAYCDAPQFFVFSDAPELLARVLPDSAIETVSVNHNDTGDRAFADLWLMSLCRHFIIADSTFSWWGAWLGACPDKRVFAPREHLLARPETWGIPGQLPDSWIAL